MTTPPGVNYCREGLAPVEAGKYEEGWNCLREHLCGASQDAEAQIDQETMTAPGRETTAGMNRPGVLVAGRRES